MRYRAFAISGALALLSSMTSWALATDLIPHGASWRYLNPIDATQDPTTNATFEANWFKPTFNANTWQGPSPAPFARADQGTTVNAIEAFTPGDSDFVRNPGTLITMPASGSRLTSYFRHDFTTAAPTNYLAMEYLIDDGARIYLDGNEISSINCCNALDDGKSSYVSRAKAVGNERSYTVSPLMIGSTLPAGSHTLAVSVFQNTPSSNDMAMGLRLFDGYVYDRLIAGGETYRYYEGFDEPSGADPLAWTRASFADGAWDSGQEGFGYDTDAATNALPLIKTTLEAMPDVYSSLYLRKAFSVADPSKYGKLELTMDFDDGFVAYINGTEVVRSNVNGNVGESVPFDALGVDHESTNNNGNPGTLFTIDLASFPNLLSTGGNNVLAIHGLNVGLDSSDFLLAQISLAGLAADVVAGKPGDYDGNDVLDAADIDALSIAVRAGSVDKKFDANGDGAVDAADRGQWIDVLKNTWIGDSNLDGEFGSADFVAVFVAGQFEDTVAGNSTWATGDWNGDAEFDTRDFVAAFTTNGFEKGKRPGGVNAVAAAVPEPSGLMLMGWAVAALCGRLRRRPANTQPNA